MNRFEACELLGISERTLRRRMTARVYSFTKHGDGQYAEVSFTHSDLGLPEPELAPMVEEIEEPEPTPAAPVAVALAPEPEEPHEPTQDELAAQWADDYRAGRVPDSFGNFIHDADPKRTLIGTPPPPEPEPDWNANYQISGHQPTAGVDGEEIFHAGSDNHPLIAGRIARGENITTNNQSQQVPTRQAFLDAIWADIRRGISR